MRFTSHRDFGRAFERALLRARIPMAYSSGFHPHPRISYANAAPTGAASEAEYLEINLIERRDPDAVVADLDAALPDGLDVVAAVEATPGALADRLEASEWAVHMTGVTPQEAQDAVARFLARASVPVDRMTKRGLRELDCRAVVVRLTAAACDDPGEKCAILTMVVRHETPTVRPDDVLVGLRQTAGLSALVPPRQTRVRQGPLEPETGAVGDPFDVGRETP